MWEQLVLTMCSLEVDSPIVYLCRCINSDTGTDILVWLICL